jgi:hypothetical protein
MWIKYYDIMRDGFSLFPFAIVGALFIAGLFNLIKSDDTGWAFTSGLFMSLIGGFIIFFMAIDFYFDYTKVKQIIEQKGYNLIEGKVTHLEKKRTSIEFKVDSVYFDTFAKDAKENVKYIEQVIDTNKVVRIHYQANRILRLWVFEDKKKR